MAKGVAVIKDCPQIALPLIGSHHPGEQTCLLGTGEHRGGCRHRPLEGGVEVSSGGQREFAPVLARAAVAVGVAAVLIIGAAVVATRRS